MIAKAALRYFALVFGAGFVLGALRVTLLVPRLGERWAELLEMPLMFVVIWHAARFVARRDALPLDRGTRLLVGVTALALLILIELGLTLWLQPAPLAEFIAARDPVSGSAYLLMLGVFALMPWWHARRV